MAISTNDHKAAVGQVEYLAMKAAVKPCTAAITQCQTNSSACLVATELCNLGLLIPYTATGAHGRGFKALDLVPGRVQSAGFSCCSFRLL